MKSGSGAAPTRKSVMPRARHELEETISPSPGFSSSVMKTVEAEAAAARSSEFPWSRALPGLLATTVAIIAALWHGIGALRDPAALAILEEEIRQVTSVAAAIGFQWLAVSAAITIVSMLLPLYLVCVARPYPITTCSGSFTK